jgi:DNA-binding beta-propeller fold protein YncE
MNMVRSVGRASRVTVENSNVALVGAVNIGRGAIADLAVDGETLVVTNFADHSVVVLDAEGLAVKGCVDAGEPFAVVAAHDRAYVSVASVAYDAIAVIDTSSGAVVGAYPLAYTGTAMTTSPDGKRVYTGQVKDDGVDVAVIDTVTEQPGIINVAKGADVTIDALRVDEGDRRLVVAVSDSRGSRLVVIDLETLRVRRVVEIGAPIRDLALGAGGIAYVLTSDIADRGVVHVVDLVEHRITGSHVVGVTPTQLTLSADGARAYIVDCDHVAVWCTDTHAVIDTISVGTRPSCIAMDRDRLYVADYAGGLTAYLVASTMPALNPRPTSAPRALVVPQVRELAVAGV